MSTTRLDWTSITAYLNSAGYRAGPELFSALDSALAQGPAQVVAHTRAVLDILMGWNAPTEALLGALVRPLLEWKLLPDRKLAGLIDPAVVEMMDHLSALDQETDVGDRRRPEVKHVHWARELGRLFAAAYQTPELVLCLLAGHWVSVSNLDALEGKKRYLLAEKCEAVFLPLLEMMGMWRWRCELGNCCLRTLKPGLYDRIQALIEDGQVENKGRYEEIRHLLQLRLQEWGIQAEVRPHHLEPSSVYRRMVRGQSLEILARQPGESLEVFAKQLSLDVLAPSVQACYQVLGAIHSLWPSLAGRFRDHLAEPKFNGYRALLTWAYMDRDRTETIAFHITTPQIDAVNQEGLVAAWYRGPERQQVPNAWWEDQPLRQRVAAVQSGSHPVHEVLAFSPVGQAFCLPANSTPLDYAFKVHSDLALHFKKAWVNGEPVDHAYRLGHGDVVRIEFDYDCRPHANWLDAAQTRTARRAIMRALARGQKAEHKGREIILDALGKEQEIYRFAIPSQKVEAFLDRTCHSLKYPSVEDLYAAVAAGQVSPDQIVHRLIAQELVRGVITAMGHPLPVATDRVRFARFKHKHNGVACRVLPGDPIVGRLKQPDTPHERLIVYTLNCPEAPRGEDLIPLAWKSEVSREAVNISITAWDRPRLLGTILNEIYSMYQDDLYLYDAHASASPEDRSAQISLTIDAPDFVSLGRLSERLAELGKRGIINAHTIVAMSPEDKLRFGARKSRQFQNPYGESVARGAMFVGRAKELEKIVHALEGETNLIVLYGEKRVGKTSILHRLQEPLLGQRGFLPIVIDLRGIGDYSLPGLISGIVRLAGQDITRRGLVEPGKRGPGLPQLDAKLLHKDPLGGFETYLDRLAERFPNRRLALLLDEFNVLDRMDRSQQPGPDFFDRLRYLVDRRKEIGFIFSIQHAAYRRTQYAKTGGWVALQNGMPVPLGYLDRDSAVKLIREPKGDMLLYDDEVVEHILELTRGHPYFLQVICSRIVSRKIIAGDTWVTSEDLQAILPDIYSSARLYFQHFLELATGHKEVVLAAIARLSTVDNPWAGISEIQETCNQLGETLSLRDIGRFARQLCGDGVLCRERFSDRWRYQIRVPLFEKWLREEYCP